MGNLLIIGAFGTVALAGGCSGNSGGGGGGGETDEDTNGDVVSSFEECIAVCEAAIDETRCNDLYLNNDFLDDATVGCRWTTFTAKQILPDAACLDGDSIERCLCVVSGSESVEPDYTVGCGTSVGTLSYVMLGGTPYLHQGSLYSSPLNAFHCGFDAEGTATPPECACFCDWQDDPAIICDYDTSICVDASHGLTWDIGAMSEYGSEWSRLAEAKAHCAGSTLGGFDDWRLPTIDELRTLVRGCPRNEDDGACPVSESCAEISCAGECTPCGSSDPLDPDEPCAFCADFSGEPCGTCPEQDEDEVPPCYLPLDFALPYAECEYLWSSTAPQEIPDAGSNYGWAIDSARGAPAILGDYEASDGPHLVDAVGFCVRSGG